MLADAETLGGDHFYLALLVVEFGHAFDLSEGGFVAVAETMLLF